jgi:hypothetical protein
MPLRFIWGLWVRIKSFTTLLAASCASVTNHHCSLPSSSISHAKTTSTSKQPSVRKPQYFKGFCPYRLCCLSVCLPFCRTPSSASNRSFMRDCNQKSVVHEKQHPIPYDHRSSGLQPTTLTHASTGLFCRQATTQALPRLNLTRNLAGSSSLIKA